MSDSVVRGLVEAGALSPVEMPADADFPVIEYDAHGMALSGEQQEAVEILSARVAAKKYAAILLDGVTGSGKTEVILRRWRMLCGRDAKR